MEWDRQNAVTQTENTEKMSLVGHLRCSCWVMLPHRPPQATTSANSRPCPFALQAITHQEPVKLISLLKLREIVVQEHWVRSKPRSFVRSFAVLAPLNAA